MWFNKGNPSPISVPHTHPQSFFVAILYLNNSENNSGNLTLDISTLTTSPGDVNLVISSYNKYPYESELSIITPEGPYIMYHSYEVIDDSNGNGNRGIFIGDFSVVKESKTSKLSRGSSIDYPSIDKKDRAI